ncbi:hypothetical protein EF888_02535 [Silicimonas algicola]|uniref:Peptidase C13-like protein n=1 Tax=Silicimonas algicola TaxID=1826607 RepID=A0A316GCX8_9RHOB|nr:C13 family peptidase [Silicimonas algicola]AZQ66100.1 hypothetical protein EF888_02535 [Silicimonas algicola]PWK58403.1 peptidase C13-like protein [Silicimonas algicola]
MSEPSGTSEVLSGGLLARSVENLSTVIRRILPGADTRPVHAGSTDALVAFVVLIAIEALVYVILVSPGSLTYWEMRGFAGGVVFHVLAALLVAVAARRGEVVPDLAVGLLWALTIGLVLAFVAGFVIPPDGWLGWIIGYALPSMLPAVLFLLATLGPVTGGIAALAFVVSVGLVTLEWAGVPLWTNDEEVASEAPPVPDTEALYAAQPDLLRQQTAALRSGQAGVPELFAVLGAGHPYEGVFAREVDAVADQLATDFGAEGRVIRLVNDAATPAALPLLNRTNLATALFSVGRAMNEEDILLLFITSHGAPGLLSTWFNGAISRDLQTGDLARILDEARIPNAVIVVSACYSGSFVEALRASNRLILTAARADRASFGCAAENEWTDWGRAFFQEGLAESFDPREAARIAQDIVAENEAREGYDASQPQIAEGASIGAALDRWLATLQP